MNDHERRLATLHKLLDCWVAEYPAILAADAVRAAHHAEAIADLQLLIERLAVTIPGTGGVASPQSEQKPTHGRRTITLLC